MTSTLRMLWIALKFFVLLQSKQPLRSLFCAEDCCELLSNFLYFCSRNNQIGECLASLAVVNCSQIFCTFAVETTWCCEYFWLTALWIALKFFVLLQSKQPRIEKLHNTSSCELLSNFLYFCSRNNTQMLHRLHILLWIALKFFVLLQSKQLSQERDIFPVSCELLSNFLYFCSRNNPKVAQVSQDFVVNCSQIFCTFAVETTAPLVVLRRRLLWIALKFFVLLQSKQQYMHKDYDYYSCELLSNFLYFCSRNNKVLWMMSPSLLWIALKFFVLLQSKQQFRYYIVSEYGCELLSNFLYFCSRNNYIPWDMQEKGVVNCSQIFCTFAVETTLLGCCQADV